MPSWEPFSLKLPDGLRLASRNVAAADDRQVPLHLFRLPDGSDMEMAAVPRTGGMRRASRVPPRETSHLLRAACGGSTVAAVGATPGASPVGPP